MHPSTRKTLLITGANGLLGQQTIAAWHETHSLHALVHTPPANPLPGVTYHRIDLATAWDDSRLPARIDAVLHLAQSAHMRDFPARARDIYAVTTDATSRLLDYACRAGAQHFIFTSTGGLYAPSATPLTEASAIAIQPGPLAHYFANKYASELLVTTYAAQLTPIILRPFFIYGPTQRDSMLIPRLIARVKNGEPITLQGPNGIAINPLHVSDAVACLARAWTLTGAHTINIAGPEMLTIRTIGEQIGDAIGKAPTFLTDAAAPDMVADITHMSATLLAPRARFADQLHSFGGAAHEPV
ncbi:MAG: NAD-dependent epimerase/dehydratase family protein [Pseudomonadota bacterium]